LDAEAIENSSEEEMIAEEAEEEPDGELFEESNWDEAVERSTDSPICENCGQPIGKLESPRAWNEHIVCPQCRQRLAEADAEQRRVRALLAIANTANPLLLTVIVIVGAVAVVAVFVKGGEWTLLNVGLPVSRVAGAAQIVVGLPCLACLFARKSRPFGGLGLFLYSYIAGFALWLVCLTVLNIMWGPAWMVTGLFFAGVGVVPLTFIALLFSGEWLMIGELLLGVGIIIASRAGGLAAIGSADALE
jgi:hypothetical protein